MACSSAPSRAARSFTAARTAGVPCVVLSTRSSSLRPPVSYRPTGGPRVDHGFAKCVIRGCEDIVEHEHDACSAELAGDANREPAKRIGRVESRGFEDNLNVLSVPRISGGIECCAPDVFVAVRDELST